MFPLVGHSLRTTTWGGCPAQHKNRSAGVGISGGWGINRPNARRSPSEACALQKLTLAQLISRSPSLLNLRGDNRFSSISLEFADCTTDRSSRSAVSRLSLTLVASGASRALSICRDACLMPPAQRRLALRLLRLQLRFSILYLQSSNARPLP